MRCVLGSDGVPLRRRLQSNTGRVSGRSPHVRRCDERCLSLSGLLVSPEESPSISFVTLQPGALLHDASLQVFVGSVGYRVTSAYGTFHLRVIEVSAPLTKCPPREVDHAWTRPAAVNIRFTSFIGRLDHDPAGGARARVRRRAVRVASGDRSIRDGGLVEHQFGSRDSSCRSAAADQTRRHDRSRRPRGSSRNRYGAGSATRVPSSSIRRRRSTWCPRARRTRRPCRACSKR